MLIILIWSERISKDCFYLGASCQFFLIFNVNVNTALSIAADIHPTVYTFGGLSAHLAYLVHKSGRKTLIIIITSDSICCLFYSASSPILLAKNRSVTLVFVTKCPRMHQILHFPQLFQGRTSNPIPLSSNAVAMVLWWFYRPP